MPRTTLTPVTLKNLHVTPAPAANALDVAPAAADVANGNDYVPSEKDLLIVQNSHATNAYYFTLFGSADPYGRSVDVTQYSLAAGEIAVVPVPAVGYRQADNKVWLAAENAAIKFAVCRFA